MAQTNTESAGVTWFKNFLEALPCGAQVTVHGKIDTDQANLMMPPGNHHGHHHTAASNHHQHTSIEYAIDIGCGSHHPDTHHHF
jgi:hypothetical protein